MTQDTEIVCYYACLKLINTYCWAFDQREADRLIDVFSTNARWTRPNGQTSVGHDAIRESFLATPNNLFFRHSITNFLLERFDGVTATGRSLVTVYNGPKPETGLPQPSIPSALVAYTDTFEKVGSEWKITERISERVLAA